MAPNNSSQDFIKNKNNNFKNSVFFVTTQRKQYDLDQPYMNPALPRYNGTGFCVKYNGKKFFVTAAHVVHNAVNLEIKFVNQPDNYQAKVKHIDATTDLAVLELTGNTSDLDNKIEWLELSKTFDEDDVGKNVSVVGFPAGGDGLAVTGGQIVRILWARSAHSAERVTLVQVDAAINPGNSGGPVILNNQVVGVGILSCIGLQNTNFMVPITLVKNFLEQSVLDKNAKGIPWLPLVYQDLSNPHLRAYYGLKQNQTGCLVINTDGCTEFEKNDILTHIDGTPITNKGEILHHGVYLPLMALIQEKKLGEVVTFSAIRRGETTEIKYPLHTTYNKYFRVKTGLKACTPHFYILSGLVFQALFDDGRNKVDYAFYSKAKKPNKKEIIALSEVLSSSSTNGYADLSKQCILKAFNGIELTSIAHLMELAENSTANEHVLTLYCPEVSSDLNIVVPNLERAPDEKTALLTQFGIYCDRSEKLKKQTKANAKPDELRESADTKDRLVDSMVDESLRVKPI